eukprot:1159882-Pelagomonas_calceolata.AAC.2
MGGDSVILWYFWPSLQLRYCASCNASSAKCYSAHPALLMCASHTLSWKAARGTEGSAGGSGDSRAAVAAAAAAAAGGINKQQTSCNGPAGCRDFPSG